MSPSRVSGNFGAHKDGRGTDDVIQHRTRVLGERPICGGPSLQMDRRFQESSVNIYKPRERERKREGESHEEWDFFFATRRGPPPDELYKKRVAASHETHETTLSRRDRRPSREQRRINYVFLPEISRTRRRCFSFVGVAPERPRIEAEERKVSMGPLLVDE